jgi:hypothetical protein
MTLCADGGIFLNPPRSMVKPEAQLARPERRLVWVPQGQAAGESLQARGETT